jgi:hypothetical protein
MKRPANVRKSPFIEVPPSSIQTTERYLGTDQEIVVAVNDHLGL